MPCSVTCPSDPVTTLKRLCFVSVQNLNDTLQSPQNPTKQALSRTCPFGQYIPRHPGGVRLSPHSRPLPDWRGWPRPGILKVRQNVIKLLITQHLTWSVSSKIQFDRRAAGALVGKRCRQEGDHPRSAQTAPARLRRSGRQTFSRGTAFSFPQILPRPAPSVSRHARNGKETGEPPVGYGFGTAAEHLGACNKRLSSLVGNMHSIGVAVRGLLGNRSVYKTPKTGAFAPRLVQSC
jgi:hypothetical protein